MRAISTRPRSTRKALRPLKDDFAHIDAIADKHALSAYLGSTLRADVDALNSTNFYTGNLFGVWISQAFEDPAHNVPYMLQGGLGMPDRDYYIQKSAKMDAIRAKYRAHIAAMLKLAGIADAEKKAQGIFDLETKIANTHATREESEDVAKANNPWKRADFAAKAPGLDWDAYFKAASLDAQQDFIAWHPHAIAGESALVASEPVAVWKDWLTYHAIEHFAGVLPKPFVDERFAFYGTVLTGTPKLRDRWKRAIDSTNGNLGEVVGRLYVAKHFPPSAKAKIEAMVKNLLTAYHARIAKLAWMSPKTKEKALAKLGTLRVGVGYPDKWRDYSSLEIVRGDALGNLKRSEMFEYRYNLAKLHQPVDRGEWSMVPQEVNAVNLPLANALNFPAAILQPPFFDPEADAAMNYGAIGATIGHEISHSFDDSGSQFDAAGPVRELVDAGRPRAFPRVGRAACGAIRCLQAVPRSACPRQADLEREHRRCRGTVRGARRLCALARRKEGAGAAGALRRPALLPRLYAELAREGTRGSAAPADPHRRSRAGGISRRHGAQSRRLVSGVRREAGAEAPSRAEGPRAGVVRPGQIVTG